MLFKLSFRNMRRSMRDYAIYFFTLIVGVSIFYVFNAVGDQTVTLELSESQNEVIKLLNTAISGVSVFVAFVLALLIVYASRFLMKRRNQEFALYMLLGMSKGEISGILLLETVLVGIASMVTGLVLGIGLSQLMSALVVNLFEADMSSYRFMVSGKSAAMTVLYFAVMYLVVMVLNSAAVTRMQLINLMQSGKKSEKIRLKNPVLCVLIFVISAVALGVAYYQVGWNYNKLNQNTLLVYIIIGVVTTFFIFWSVSGLLLRIIMSMKNTYHRGLNAFTFRQISSSVNTMVFSMTVICLMLFVTICALTSAFSIRNAMNSNLEELCRVDAQILFVSEESTSDIYEDYGYDITEDYRDYTELSVYGDEAFTMKESLGAKYEEAQNAYPFMIFDGREDVVGISEYNNLRKLYGQEPLSLSEDEYIVISDFDAIKKVRDSALEDGSTITVFGKELKSKYDECVDGYITIGAQPLNTGVFIVPDSVLPENEVQYTFFVGNYNGDTKEELAQIEEAQRNIFEKISTDWIAVQTDASGASINTKIDIYDSAIGLGAIVAFLGLYIGMVFLVACGAILALKELSEHVDSLPRYEMLRKIGVEEKDITHSIFRQVGIFFLLPLVLAIIHSVFGMKFSVQVLEIFGTDGIAKSIGLTSVILAFIYGGYFIVTFLTCKGDSSDRM
ncbi:MAG: FtsX-like permease family protein [Lachnospiraceae bacterium]|nr:FtsX-like permease family protein [Lachnospiraceae bacterium]